MATQIERTTATPAATHTHAAPFRVELQLADGYEFLVNPVMPGAAPFVIDEPPPLGKGLGPNPTRVLASALASCLGASLLFCLRKMRVAVHGLTVSATGTLARNEHGRLRVAGIAVELRPTIDAADLERLPRCVEVFEDYCVVTQSVRQALDVTVSVTPTTA